MFNFEPFDPSDDTQLFNLMKDGEYDFCVKHMQYYTSPKNGNQSLKTSIQVFDNDGSSKIIECYLTPNYKKLFAHFFSSVGCEDDCKTGAIMPDKYVNLTGRCVIGIDRNEGTTFDPKNIIVDFVKSSSPQKKQDIDPDLNDSIPF